MSRSSPGEKRAEYLRLKRMLLQSALTPKRFALQTERTSKPDRELQAADLQAGPELVQVMSLLASVAVRAFSRELALVVKNDEFSDPPHLEQVVGT